MRFARGRKAAPPTGIAGDTITRSSLRAAAERLGRLEVRFALRAGRAILRVATLAGRALLSAIDASQAHPILAAAVAVLFGAGSLGLAVIGQDPAAGRAFALAGGDEGVVAAAGPPTDDLEALLARLQAVDRSVRAARAEPVSTTVAPPAPVAPPLVSATDPATAAVFARAATSAAPASGPGSAGRLSAWPHPGAMTGWFGEPRGGHTHSGIDLDGDTGDPVMAAGAGTVRFAGFGGAEYSGYGMIVLIDHGGFTTLSAHLSSLTVGTGDRVEAGQVVGAVGTTGNVTGSHLHFEVRLGGRPVDPVPYLPPR